MCGRLVLTSDYKNKIKAIFDLVETDEWLPPRYNITPGQKLPVLLQSDPRSLQWIDWGHMPSSPAATGQRRTLLINARGETAHRLPTFKSAFQDDRCIVLADGFYEWKRTPGGKSRPYFFFMKDRRAFPLAGLILKNNETADRRCVVVTTEANSIMHRIHNRMPVIFTPESAETWLNSGTGAETLKTILQPFPSGEMDAYPVSDRVNRASSEGPELIEQTTVVEQIEMF